MQIKAVEEQTREKQEAKMSAAIKLDTINQPLVTADPNTPPYLLHAERLLLLLAELQALLCDPKQTVRGRILNEAAPVASWTVGLYNDPPRGALSVENCILVARIGQALIQCQTDPSGTELLEAL